MAVKKNTLLIATGSLLILLLIGVTILLISEKQTNKELIMEGGHGGDRDAVGNRETFAEKGIV